MKKFAHHAVLLGWLFVTFLVPGLEQAEEEIGIDRSSLTRENEAVQEKTLEDIHALHARWFRDVLSGTTQQIVANQRLFRRCLVGGLFWRGFSLLLMPKGRWSD
jgi:hypothetical protein